MAGLLLIPADFFQQLLKSTIALLVVLDPLGIVPMYIAITEKMESAKRVEASKTIVITSAGLLFAFAIAGTQIFTVFGITLYGFMVAGGVLLFIVAVELLKGGQSFMTRPEESEHAGIVPLAFPLLAGPGAITAVIIALETTGLVVTILSIAIVIGITYVILHYSDRIYRILGKRGSLIVSRVFAVFVAAIAVQYIVQGVKALF
jgi:multiple antibiotic resistance protein